MARSWTSRMSRGPWARPCANRIARRFTGRQAAKDLRTHPTDTQYLVRAAEIAAGGGSRETQGDQERGGSVGSLRRRQPDCLAVPRLGAGGGDAGGSGDRTDAGYALLRPPDHERLGSEFHVVAVTLDGKQLYLDPGTALAPFGVLPWNETAVSALRLDKDGGSWIDIPLPEAAESRVERRANLKLTPLRRSRSQVSITRPGSALAPQ